MTVIREASEDDLPGLVSLYGQLKSEGLALTLERARKVFDDIRQYPNYRVFVAEDRVLLGTFALLIFEALGYRGKPVGVVEDVVVEESSRGRGVGREMMQFAIEQCRQAGCYKMMLSSNLTREDAHRFYDSLGFERHGYSFRVRPQSE